MNVSVTTDSREDRGPGEEPSWINPTAEPGGVSQYLEALRGAWWLIVVTVVACVGVNLAFLARAEKVYEATAYLVVSPVSDRGGNYAGLSILRETSDPARNLETLATVITTPAVARRVQTRRGASGNPRALLNDVEAVPVAQSDLLAIRARGSTPESAQRLANAFAEATIEYRTRQLHGQIDALVADLRPLVRQQGRATDAEPSGRLLAQRLARLEALRAGPDPTVRVESAAALPTEPIAPKPVISTAVSLIAGLLLGVGAVFGLQLIDPRVRSERQLRELYRLPILVRVPKIRRPLAAIRRRFGASTAAAWDIDQESYPALRAAIMSGGGNLPLDRSVLVTGPSSRDGKTTTAIGLARALAQSGERTTLLEADSRRPSIGSRMGISSPIGLHSTMSGSAAISDALVHPPAEPTELKVLLAEHDGPWLADLLTPATADRLLTELDEESDWTVIDSPPLGQVIDPLPLALLAGQLLLVVRLGKSQLGALKRLTELLAQHDIRPSGFVVIGGRQTSYYG